MPQAVSSLPSMAKPTGPVTRCLPLLSSKIDSSGVSGGLTSAVALTNLMRLYFRRRRPRRGLDLELGQRAVPLIDRPGPPSGRFGSLSSSSRKAVMFWTSCLHRHLHRVLGRRIALGEERAVGSGRYFCPPVDISSTSGRTTVHSG